MDLRRRPLNRLFGGGTQWPESVTYHGAGIALRPVPHIKRLSRSSRRANLQEQWRDGHSDFILLAISKSQAQPRYLSIRVRKRFHARQFSGVAVGRQPGDQSYRQRAFCHKSRDRRFVRSGSSPGDPALAYFWNGSIDGLDLQVHPLRETGAGVISRHSPHPCKLVPSNAPPRRRSTNCSHLQLNPKTVEFSALRASQVAAQELRSRDGTRLPHSPAPPDARVVSSSAPRKANSQQP